MSHCFLHHPVRVVRVVRRGHERHLHGLVFVAPEGASASVAAAPCRPIVHQQYQIFAIVISFFEPSFWHQEGLPLASVTAASACVPPAKLLPQGRPCADIC